VTNQLTPLKRQFYYSSNKAYGSERPREWSVTLAPEEEESDEEADDGQENQHYPEGDGENIGDVMERNDTEGTDGGEEDVTTEVVPDIADAADLWEQAADQNYGEEEDEDMEDWYDDDEDMEDCDEGMIVDC